MTSPKLSPAIPQLPTGNLEATARFFKSQLGFEVVAQLEEHGHLTVRRGPAEIHFWLAATEDAARDIGRMSSCYIRVENIGPFFDEIRARKTIFRYELTKMPWGMNEFQIDDPFGNAIRFGEPC